MQKNLNQVICENIYGIIYSSNVYLFVYLHFHSS